MSRFASVFVALVLAVASQASWALGLGSLISKSALNQPFKGEIQLYDAKADELDSVQAKLASPDEFEKASVPRPYFLTQLKFEPRLNEDGDPVILVFSRDPIREPFMDFLVEVVWPEGRIVKEYTILLDPPRAGVDPPDVVVKGVLISSEVREPPAPAVPEPEPETESAVVVVERPAPSVAEPEPEATGGQADDEAGSDASPDAPDAADAAATAQAGSTAAEPAGASAPSSEIPADAGGDFPIRYGPVKAGTGLWRVAKSMAPEGATIPQVAMALYRSNPKAFGGGSVNNLITGSNLMIPSAAELYALDPNEASREFTAALNGQTVRSEPLAPAGGPQLAQAETDEQAVAGDDRPASQVKKKPDTTELEPPSDASAPAPAESPASEPDAGEPDAGEPRTADAEVQEFAADEAQAPASEPEAEDAQAESGTPALAAADQAVEDRRPAPETETADASPSGAADAELAEPGPTETPIETAADQDAAAEPAGEDEAVASAAASTDGEAPSDAESSSDASPESSPEAPTESGLDAERVADETAPEAESPAEQSAASASETTDDAASEDTEAVDAEAPTTAVADTEASEAALGDSSAAESDERVADRAGAAADATERTGSTEAPVDPEEAAMRQRIQELEAQLSKLGTLLEEKATPAPEPASAASSGLPSAAVWSIAGAGGVLLAGLLGFLGYRRFAGRGKPADQAADRDPAPAEGDAPADAELPAAELGGESMVLDTESDFGLPESSEVSEPPRDALPEIEPAPRAEAGEPSAPDMRPVSEPPPADRPEDVLPADELLAGPAPEGPAQTPALPEERATERFAEAPAEPEAAAPDDLSSPDHAPPEAPADRSPGDASAPEQGLGTAAALGAAAGLTALEAAQPESDSAKPEQDAKPALAAAPAVQEAAKPAHTTESPAVVEKKALSKADIYISYGRYREAQTTLLAALESVPGSAALRFKLAEAYVSAGNLAEFETLKEDMRGLGLNERKKDAWNRMLAIAASAGFEPAVIPPAGQAVPGSDSAQPEVARESEPAAEDTPSADLPELDQFRLDFNDLDEADLKLAFPEFQGAQEQTPSSPQAEPPVSAEAAQPGSGEPSKPPAAPATDRDVAMPASADDDDDVLLNLDELDSSVGTDAAPEQVSPPVADAERAPERPERSATLDRVEIAPGEPDLEVSLPIEDWDEKFGGGELGESAFADLDALQRPEDSGSAGESADLESAVGADDLRKAVSDEPPQADALRQLDLEDSGEGSLFDSVEPEPKSSLQRATEAARATKGADPFDELLASELEDSPVAEPSAPAASEGGEDSLPDLDLPSLDDGGEEDADWQKPLAELPDPLAVPGDQGNVEDADAQAKEPGSLPQADAGAGVDLAADIEKFLAAGPDQESTADGGEDSVGGLQDLDLNLTPDTGFDTAALPSSAPPGHSPMTLPELDMGLEDLDSFANESETTENRGSAKPSAPGGLSGMATQVLPSEATAGDAGRSSEAGSSDEDSPLFGDESLLAPDSGASDVLSSQWRMDSGLWDEVATKMDLAYAYVEMEDAEAARSILEEVLREGNDDQRKEAEGLMKKLDG